MHFDIILQHNNDAFFRKNVEQYTVEFIIAPESYSLNKVIRGVCMCVRMSAMWIECKRDYYVMRMSTESTHGLPFITDIVPYIFT